ncbi:hypothetical protein EVAR_14762_1 [Eumeta japonica]|uniref:Uncharacterized protein n=1 Tax=Eumeta variegata TaxID=151549 RepID=A0A4C1TWF7_EUMVA|nr:hypothetical protein EVAR_14762_1 [Eumeta japonica]
MFELEELLLIKIWTIFNIIIPNIDMTVTQAELASSTVTSVSTFAPDSYESKLCPVAVLEFKVELGPRLRMRSGSQFHVGAGD